MRYLDTSIALESKLKNASHRNEADTILAAISEGKETAVISVLNVSELFYILLNREKFTLAYVNAYIERMHILTNSKIFKD